MIDSIHHKVENARQGGVRLTKLYKLPPAPCSFLHEDGLVEFLESVQDRLDTSERVLLEFRFPYSLDVEPDICPWWENHDYLCHAHLCRVFALEFGATNIESKNGHSLSGWIYPEQLIFNADKLIDLLMEFEGDYEDQVVVRFADTIITIANTTEH